MNLVAILANIRFPDILDILFISIVTYQLYVWFWGTKAFKAFAGIVLLSGIYVLAETWGLFLTTWVFQILWQVFVILLIILFQKEIRQMLERFNPLKKLGYRQSDAADAWVRGFSEWAFDAANKKMGALIVFERSDLVFDLITKGVAIESEPVPEVLTSLFVKDSPLHDGAGLISNGRILKASCFLPLSVREDLPKEWGTRHRAALGLTEQCDACVVIVSEERGEVSLAVDQKIEKVDTKEALAEKVLELAQSAGQSKNGHLKERLLSWVTRRYQVKLAVFVSVFALWLAFAGQQNFEKRIPLSLQLENVPADLRLEGAVDASILITCRGLRKDVSLLNKNNISASLDLFTARSGTHSFHLTQRNLDLPNDRVHVVNISPARVELSFETSDR